MFLNFVNNSAIRRLWAAWGLVFARRTASNHKPDNNAMTVLNQTPAGWCLEQAALEDLAREFGTPLYVYSQAGIVAQWHAMDRAFGTTAHQIYYALKACSNIGILNLLARLGSGFEVVSGGELYRVMRAGGNPKQVMFSGVGKKADEIEQALQAEVRCLNVESAAELMQIESIAKTMGRVASVALRINPDIDAETHEHITTGRKANKFGVAEEEAFRLYRYADSSEHLRAVGIGCHIGSQITDLRPLAQAAAKMVQVAGELVQAGLPVEHLNLGGGLGITYDTPAPGVEEYVKALVQASGDCPWELVIEPGRSIVGQAGILLTRVLYLKHKAGKHFAIVDAAMNDLMRPVLYQARHPIQKITASDGEQQMWEVVGPVCESGDCLQQQCAMTLAASDLLAILSAGAYGFSMASQYNSRPRPAELLVDGHDVHQIRRRETLEGLVEGECLPTHED